MTDPRSDGKAGTAVSWRVHIDVEALLSSLNTIQKHEGRILDKYETFDETEYKL